MNEPIKPTLGMVHVYTGNGKGKTTAAFGLAARAVCAGLRVYVGQFVKSMAYHETQLAQAFPERLTIEQLGEGCFIDRTPTAHDVAQAQAALAHCRQILQGGQHDLVVLDELTIATHFKLLTAEQVIATLAGRAPQTEVVITGRYAPIALLDYADLVTDMQEVKHYYQQGVRSRPGIDC